MKIIIFLLTCILLSNAVGYTQPLFELSQNIYRVPYGNNLKLSVNNDHTTHNPPGRYDLAGADNGVSCSFNYPIVAAAEGIIRRIVDNNNTRPPDCDPNCASFNNYVWIEHSNGEWSKYTHLAQNSVTFTAGLSVGDQVCAGRLLGYECDVGQSTGPHLHFEVRRPLDTANVQITVAGGFMTNADHLIPVINSNFKHFFQVGDGTVASGGSNCIAPNYTLSTTTLVVNTGISIYMAGNGITTTPGTSIQYFNGANGLYQAGNSVTLSAGFEAKAGSYFTSRIQSCATTNYPGGCN